MDHSSLKNILVRSVSKFTAKYKTGELNIRRKFLILLKYKVDILICDDS